MDVRIVYFMWRGKPRTVRWSEDNCTLSNLYAWAESNAPTNARAYQIWMGNEKMMQVTL